MENDMLMHHVSCNYLKTDEELTIKGGNMYIDNCKVTIEAKSIVVKDRVTTIKV